MKTKRNERSQINAFTAHLVISESFCEKVFSPWFWVRMNALSEEIESFHVRVIMTFYPKHIRELKTLDKRRAELASWLVEKFEL